MKKELVFSQEVIEATISASLRGRILKYLMTFLIISALTLCLVMICSIGHTKGWWFMGIISFMISSFFSLYFFRFKFFLFKPSWIIKKTTLNEVENYLLKRKRILVELIENIDEEIKVSESKKCGHQKELESLLLEVQ